MDNSGYQPEMSASLREASGHGMPGFVMGDSPQIFAVLAKRGVGFEHGKSYETPGKFDREVFR